MVKMYNQGSHLSKGTRVRLRANVDPAIYGEFACVGNEGTVAGVREDRFGLPEVFIQWDKNHWAYNGIHDGWTFEDHFELVEENMANSNDAIQAIVQGIASLLGDNAGNDSSKEVKPNQVDVLTGLFKQTMENFQPQPDDVVVDDEFEQVAEAAARRIADSDAFLVIGIDRHDHPRAPEGMLDPFVIGHSKADDSDVILTAYMGTIAARAHYALALDSVARQADA